MKALMALAIACVFFTEACTSSLNPLYTVDDLIFDRALVGTWTDPEETETWEFTYCGDKEYKLVYTDEDGKAGEFHARLLKIGGKTFLDLTPVMRGMPQNNFYQGHLLAAHSFIQISHTGPTYQVSYLEPEWLKKFLEKEPAALRHAVVGHEIVLTDSSKNLQKFLAGHLNSPGAFSEPFAVKRKKKIGQADEY